MNEKPNVILIVMDNVRYDHLSCYGYDRMTTPNIDKFAKESILFENAFSVSSWTPPTMSSIFTGKYPSNHGVLDKNLRLDPKNITLAELLRKDGYRTLEISSIPYLHGKFGINKGFDLSIEHYTKPIFDFDMKYIWGKIRNLKFGNDKYTYYNNIVAKRWIRKYMDKPFFLLIDYENTHIPYHPMKPFHEYILRDNHKDVNINKVRYLFGEQSFIKNILKVNESYGFAAPVMLKYMANKFDLTDEEMELGISWYDSEIAYLDYHVGKLLEFLKKNELFDDSIIIITADHGANLKEHGRFFYSLCSLYDTNTHIPFIIKVPNGKKKKVKGLISQVDFMPTIIDILGIDIPVNIDGKSMSGFRESECRKYVMGELGTYDGVKEYIEKFLPSYDTSLLQRLKFIRTGTHKLIMGSEGREEFYDLMKDPKEENNMIEKNPKEARRLKSELLRNFKNLETKKTKSVVEDIDV